MRKPWHEYSSFEIPNLYPHKTIDLDYMFRDVKTLESCLFYYKQIDMDTDFIHSPDFDLEKALSLGKMYGLKEWSELPCEEIETYNEGHLKYGYLCQYLLGNSYTWRRNLYFEAQELRKTLRLMYVVSGLTDWETEDQAIDMFEIYEKLLATLPGTEDSKDLSEKYLLQCWEHLLQNSPLNRNVFYAFQHDPKEDGLRVRSQYLLRNPTLQVRPSNGFLFYFETEKDRNEFVAEDPEDREAILDLKDFLELQWKCTDAIKYQKGAYQHTTHYVVTLEGRIYAIYDDVEVAKSAAAMFPYRGVYIHTVPLVSKVDLQDLVAMAKEDISKGALYSTEEVKKRLGLK